MIDSVEIMNLVRGRYNIERRATGEMTVAQLSRQVTLAIDEISRAVNKALEEKADRPNRAGPQRGR